MQRKVSFVIPAYNEAESLTELYIRIKKNIDLCTKEALMSDHEILFIDDGSTDHTDTIIRQLKEQDDKVRYILFRKNFGKSIALQTAFKNIDGDLVITMDADLQDDPSELKNFLMKIDEGYDMVVGWKVNRLDSAEKKIPSKLFNKVTSEMSGIKLHDFDCGYKIFRREVADSLNIYGQLHRYIPVLAYRNGFMITEMPVHHNRRKYGKSKYGMERYMQGLFDFMTVFFLTKFSDRPMYFFGRWGLLFSGVGFMICLFLSFMRTVGHEIETKSLPQLGSLLFILWGGVQSISIGLIGNMLVDATYQMNHTEAHVKEKSS